MTFIANLPARQSRTWRLQCGRATRQAPPTSQLAAVRDGNYLVLCEVLYPDGSPHGSNQRAVLRRALDAAGPKAASWVGFEQEYTIYRDGRPLGFPANGFHPRQVYTFYKV